MSGTSRVAMRRVYVDAHAHLDMLDDPAGALASAARAGVALVVTVVDLSEDTRTLTELPAWLERAQELLADEGDASAIPEVRMVVGVHPHNARLFTPSMADRMREAASIAGVVALGELGLDYHYDHSPRDVQRAVFEQHLELADACGLPAIVHLREAHDDGWAMLKGAMPRAGCVIHCFTEDAAIAERFLELGCMISFAGPVTFKKADAIREAAAIVPVDRLLTETDCPFLAPEPYRGARNEPALVVHVAETIARIKGVEPPAFLATVLDNARKLFVGREDR